MSKTTYTLKTPSGEYPGLLSLNAAMQAVLETLGTDAYMSFLADHDVDYTSEGHYRQSVTMEDGSVFSITTVSP